MNTCEKCNDASKEAYAVTFSCFRVIYLCRQCGAQTSKIEEGIWKAMSAKCETIRVAAAKELVGALKEWIGD